MRTLIFAAIAATLSACANDGGSYGGYYPAATYPRYQPSYPTTSYNPGANPVTGVMAPRVPGQPPPTYTPNGMVVPQIPGQY